MAFRDAVGIVEPNFGGQRLQRFGSELFGHDLSVQPDHSESVEPVFPALRLQMVEHGLHQRWCEEDFRNLVGLEEFGE